MGKRTASAETLKPDPRYNSKLAGKFINCLMWQGKKATAMRVFYGALDQIKKEGFAVYGVDERGLVDYDKAQYASPAALVLGGEGKGLHEMVRKRCDSILRIPMAGKISSLNVSVAAGIVLFDWKRRVQAGLPDL